MIEPFFIILIKIVDDRTSRFYMPAYIYVCRWMVTIFRHSWAPSNRTKCPSFLTWLRPFNFALFSGVQVCTAGIFQPNKFFFPWFAAATNFVQRELPVDAKGRDGRLQAVYHCQLKWWKKVGACSILCCIDHSLLLICSALSSRHDKISSYIHA